MLVNKNNSAAEGKTTAAKVLGMISSDPEGCGFELTAMVRHSQAAKVALAGSRRPADAEVFLVPSARQPGQISGEVSGHQRGAKWLPAGAYSLAAVNRVRRRPEVLSWVG